LFHAKVNSVIAEQFEGNPGALREEEVLQAIADDCSIDEVGLVLNFLEDVCWPGKDILSHYFVELETGLFCGNDRFARSYKDILRLLREALEKDRRPVAKAELVKAIYGNPTQEQVENIERVLYLSPSILRLQSGHFLLRKESSISSRELARRIQLALRLLDMPKSVKEISDKMRELYHDMAHIEARAVKECLQSRPGKFAAFRPGSYGLRGWVRRNTF
jgi:hypothetical protein